MNEKTPVLVLAWMPEGALARLAGEFTNYEFIDAREVGVLDRHWRRAVIAYGQPPGVRLPEASGLRWFQLNSAGVPQEFCPLAKQQKLTVTNLAGLYGPTIAAHALTLMLMLSRNLHLALRQQLERKWNRELSFTMSDLNGKTLAIVGVGNIGQNLARLAKTFGMRVVGCRRTTKLAPHVDQLYPPSDLHAMLAEGDYVAVTAPLIVQTTGMLGPGQFAAMKKGAFYINVSRGGVAEEAALLGALRSGHLAGAALDVFATEPLPTEHPLWTIPNVIVSPHYSGETVNLSAQPAERFVRNLRAWSEKRPLEGVVDLDWGY